MDEYFQFVEYAILDNYLKFDGKINQGAVIGKIISQYPEKKNDVLTLRNDIQKVLEEVLKKSHEENNNKFESLKSKYVVEKKEKSIFDSIGIKQGEKIITAFPPGPEKYPHIGHAKASLLNYLLAKEYNGKFYLRFEDTNPDLVKEEFYGIIMRDLEWLGIKWDKLDYASDYMEYFIDCATDLVKRDLAYVCTCKSEVISENRKNSIECDCRKKSVEEQIELWKNFDKNKSGEAILRLKTDLAHKNSTMRDPAIFRIIDAKHARLGDKYKSYPMYDFQNALLDGKLGVTHRIRSKEFEMRDELHAYIRDLFKLPQTKLISIGRFNMKDMLMSGRHIRELLQSGEIDGWDDPNVGTIVALKRRGFMAEAIKNFVVSTGISKNEATMSWEDIIKQNRRILDKTAKRFFFVRNPIEIEIEGVKKQEIELKCIPGNNDLIRKINIDSHFYIEEKDYQKIIESNDELYRLMDAINFTKEKIGENKFVFKFHSNSYEDFKGKGNNIIHFVPKNESIDVDVYTPEHEHILGKGEINLKELNKGDVIQFERYAFVILDNKEKMLFYFTHN
ncbi:MAG: glutamate--tRNA ligase [Candidatus Nanoarchaeia archaeon]|nr:glutamate--tRNA ligase [Candidatus Nanoarchaeia archaeon]